MTTGPADPFLPFVGGNPMKVWSQEAGMGLISGLMGHASQISIVNAQAGAEIRS